MYNTIEFNQLFETSSLFAKVGNNISFCVLSKVELVRNFKKSKNFNHVDFLIKFEDFLSKNNNLTKIETSHIESVSKVQFEILKELNIITGEYSPKYLVYLLDDSMFLSLFCGDDLRITRLTKGCNLTNDYDDILKVEKNLQNIVSYQFDFEFGYITKNIKEMGLGLSCFCDVVSDCNLEKFNITPSKKYNILDKFRVEKTKQEKSYEYKAFDRYWYKISLSENTKDERTTLKDFEEKINDECERNKLIKISEYDEYPYLFLQKIFESKYLLNNSYLMRHMELSEILYYLAVGYSFQLTGSSIVNADELLKAIGCYYIFTDEFFCNSDEQIKNIVQDNINMSDGYDKYFDAKFLQTTSIKRASILRNLK